MMRGLSVFLLPDLLALLGAAGGGVRPVESQSEPMSEDSESQRPESAPPRLVIVRSTNSAAQTIVLVDRDHSMEAFVPAKVLQDLRAKMGYKSLARLRGSVLRLVKYQFVSRARCLGSGELEESAVSSWRVSVSMATTSRRQQRLYLWIEELSVVDASELVVDALPNVIEDTLVARLLGKQTDVELEARLAIRQNLPPLPANASTAVDAALRFGDSNPLTDMDCVIPENQERELDEQDGWGPPPAHLRWLPTDSELIEENGSVPMTELQDGPSSSDSGNLAHGEVGAASQVGDSSVAKCHDPPPEAKIEPEDEPKNTAKLHNNVVDYDEARRSPGWIGSPIDLTADDSDDDGGSGYRLHTLSRADYIYDDSELYTQPPDTSIGFEQTQVSDAFPSQGAKGTKPTERSQPEPETMALDDDVDNSFEAEEQETRSDVALQRQEAKSDSDIRVRRDPLEENRATDQESDHETQQLAETQILDDDDENSSGSQDVHALKSAAVRNHNSGRTEEIVPVHDLSDDANISQPRGFGGFLRRLASNFVMTSARKESSHGFPENSERPSSVRRESGNASKPTGLAAQIAGSASAGIGVDSQFDGSGNESDDGYSQRTGGLGDAEIWQTQAPEVQDVSGEEQPPTSLAWSSGPNYGCEQDADDADMATTSHVATATSKTSVHAAYASIDASQEVDDEDSSEFPADASTRRPPAFASPQTSATTGKTRSLVENERDEPADGALQSSPRGTPSVQVSYTSPRTPPAVIASDEETEDEGDAIEEASSASKRRRLEEPHDTTASDDDTEDEGVGAAAEEASNASKRRRLAHNPPPRDSPTSAHTSGPDGRGNDTFASGSDLHGSDGGASTSAITFADASMRPSKLLEAFFPPLRMDLILQQIAEKSKRI